MTPKITLVKNDFSQFRNHLSICPSTSFAEYTVSKKKKKLTRHPFLNLPLNSRFSCT